MKFKYKLNLSSLKLSKRRKIIIATLFITIGLIIATQTYYFVFLKTKFLIYLGLFTYLVSLWAIWEGMNKTKAIVLFILPVLYTLAVTNFYFLLPVRWMTRLPVAFAFGLSYYILLLSQNVFNVSAIRTIPLYRAASTTTFLFTIFTSVLLFHVIRALSLPFYLNGLTIFALSFLLVLPILWSIEMEKINSKIIIYTFVISLLLAEFAIALSFWPIPSNSLIWAISISSALFVFLGICLDLFRDRLQKREVYSWIGFGLFVFLVIFFTTSWTG